VRVLTEQSWAVKHGFCDHGGRLTFGTCLALTLWAVMIISWVIMWID
jgi:hypothetical protein